MSLKDAWYVTSGMLSLDDIRHLWPADYACIVGNSSLTGFRKGSPFLERSDTLTLCKEHLKLDPRAGWPRRFYSVYRPWSSRSCFTGWARISGKGDLLVAHFPLVANPAADVHVRGRPYPRGR